MRSSRVSQRLLFLLVGVVVVLGSVSVSARKELPVHVPFVQPVQDAVTCDINIAVMMNLNKHVQMRRTAMESRRLKVREDNVLGLMEHVCNPFTDDGAWVRQMAFVVNRDDKDSSVLAKTGPVLTVKVLPYFTVCKRTCATVQRMCETFMDSPIADDLSAILLRALNKFKDLTSPEATKALLEEVCYGTERCTSQDEYQKWLRTIGSVDGYTALADVEADVPERVSKDDMDMEKMMAGAFVENRQKTSVFARDEVKQLHNAIARGDRELAEELDPSMKDMSDEEFAELHHVFLHESPFASGDAMDEDGADL